MDKQAVFEDLTGKVIELTLCFLQNEKPCLVHSLLWVIYISQTFINPSQNQIGLLSFPVCFIVLPSVPGHIDSPSTKVRRFIWHLLTINRFNVGGNHAVWVDSLKLLRHIERFVLVLRTTLKHGFILKTSIISLLYFPAHWSFIIREQLGVQVPSDIHNCGIVSNISLFKESSLVYERRVGSLHRGIIFLLFWSQTSSNHFNSSEIISIHYIGRRWTSTYCTFF